jgi:hypothetical protein
MEVQGTIKQIPHIAIETLKSRTGNNHCRQKGDKPGSIKPSSFI